MKRLALTALLLLAGCGAHRTSPPAVQTAGGVRLFPERVCVIELGLRHGRFYHRCTWITDDVTAPSRERVGF